MCLPSAVTPELTIDLTRRHRQEIVSYAKQSLSPLGNSVSDFYFVSSSWRTGWNLPVFSTFKFEPKEAFAVNQVTVLAMAKELFSEAKPLGEFEQRIMNETFLDMLNDEPVFGNW